MKRILLFIFLAFATCIVKGQDGKWNIGVGGGLSLPTGDLSDYSKPGFDGFAYGAYSVLPNLYLGLGYNYVFFSKKTVYTDVKVDHTQINSFLARGLYYFGHSTFQPYVGLSTGWYNTRIKMTSTLTGKSVDAKGESNHWGYGAELGVRAGNFTLSGSFNQAASNVNYFLINVGYIINL